MTDTEQNNDLLIWGLAAIVGFVAFVMMMVIGDMGFLGSAFSAGLITVVLGALLWWVISRPLPEPVVGAVATRPVGGSHTAVQAGGAETLAATGTAGDGPSGAERAGAAAASAVVAAEKTAVAAGTAVSDAATAAVETVSEAAAGAADSIADAAEAVATGMSGMAHAVQDGAAALMGATPDTDEMSDKIENVGTRPEALVAPRGGKADNLKEIKGIGPKLEKLCNSMGFYHFDQIANWTADEIDWVNANLEGFKGRVTRDEWVSQAKLLAAGGETEFSKRVEGGDVY